MYPPLMEFLTAEKQLTTPIYGDVDITDVLPLIEIEAFQHLRRIDQLGLSHYVFLGATHTRFLHLIQTLEQIRGYTQSLFKRGMISKRDERHAEIAALLHDIGHGPFSHVLEPVLAANGSRTKDHKERTLRLIRGTFAPAIRECHADPETIALIVAKEHPLSPLLSHKTLGADKVAYLRADQHFVGYPSTPPDVLNIPRHLIYLPLDGVPVLGASERIIDSLKDLQNYYLKMYRCVYLQKPTRAFERVLERSVQQAITAGALAVDAIWGLTDNELMDALRAASGPWSSLFEKTFFGERYPHKTAVVLRNEKYASQEKLAGKDIVVVPLSDEQTTKLFTAFKNPEIVLAAEKNVAAYLGVSLDDVLITCVGRLEKLLPEDVQIFTPRGNPAGTIFEIYPQHLRSLEESAYGLTACRLHVPETLRESVSKRAEEIRDVLSGKAY